MDGLLCEAEEKEAEGMSSGKHMLINLGRSIAGYDWGRFRPSSWDKRKFGWTFSELTHPIEAFNDIKYEGRGSLMIANVICILMFVLSALEYHGKAFVFNYNEPQDFNLWTTLLTSSFLMVLWTISNWAVCSLLDGEGTFKEIWIMTCYAMLPRLLIGFPMLVVTHGLTLDESGIYSIINSISLIWSAVLLMLGMMTAHQYTVKKTVASILLTVAGLAIMFFIAVLLFSMGQQFYFFFDTVMDEIRYRM